MFVIVNAHISSIILVILRLISVIVEQLQYFDQLPEVLTKHLYNIKGLGTVKIVIICSVIIIKIIQLGFCWHLALWIHNKQWRKGRWYKLMHFHANPSHPPFSLSDGEDYQQKIFSHWQGNTMLFWVVNQKFHYIIFLIIWQVWI